MKIKLLDAGIIIALILSFRSRLLLSPWKEAWVGLFQECLLRRMLA